MQATWHPSGAAPPGTPRCLRSQHQQEAVSRRQITVERQGSIFLTDYLQGIIFRTEIKQSAVGSRQSAVGKQFRMFKNKSQREVSGMRLTPKYKNGPTVGVHAPTLGVNSPSTLVVKNASTLVVKNTSTMVKNALALVLLGLLVTFWGCSKSEEKPASSKDEPARSTESSPQTGSAANAPSAAPAAPAAVVIATADGEKAGTRVDITELKRSGDNTVTLKFAMVNDSPERLSFNYDYGDPQHSIKDFNSIGGVTLVDGANKKKYFVVRDTENSCLCSRGLNDIPAKSRGNVWAKFPAPPDDVQKISIVVPHFGPMDDVPISR